MHSGPRRLGGTCGIVFDGFLYVTVKTSSMVSDICSHGTEGLIYLWGELFHKINMIYIHIHCLCNSVMTPSGHMTSILLSILEGDPPLLLS